MSSDFTSQGLRVKRQNWAGLDFHVIATLLFRGWAIMAGAITILMIPAWLTPVQQGYFYTFASVLATQIFFELGLNHVLTQMTSHAAAHLMRGEVGSLDGSIRWRVAIQSLLALSRKWNGIMASLFFLVLLVGGSMFFSRKGILPAEDWLAVWVVLIAATSINLLFSARLAICEGLGEVGHVARLRLRQSMLGYLLLWTLLILEQGLWAAVAVPLSAAVMTGIWLKTHPRLRQLSASSEDSADTVEHVYTWRNDVFPLQWKIAVSWVAGYFIFNFLTPVVFAYQGAEAAGRLGLALTIFASISTIGMSWIYATIPELSTHIARGQRESLNRLFHHQASRSILATAVCAAGFLIALQLAGYVFPPIHGRLPSLSALILLALVTIANSAIFAMAAYIRAHKEEPLLVQSVVCALLIGAGVYWMAHISLTAVVAVYASVLVLVALPWCYRIYARYHQRTQ